MMMETATTMTTATPTPVRIQGREPAASERIVRVEYRVSIESLS